MLVSIGKSSLARAAAINARPTTETVTQQPSAILRDVAVNDIRLVKGQKHQQPTEDLVRSVEKNGVIEPLLIAQTAEGDLLLLSGARRLTAAKELGLEMVSAVVVTMTATEVASARREIVRFAVKSEQSKVVVSEQSTAVGQAMPAWLL